MIEWAVRQGSGSVGTTAPYGVNGRFLTQPVTGVQRYALNVTRAMSAALAARGQSVPLLAPQGAADPGLSAMPLRQVGRRGGHVWEQLELPRAWPDRLLNLCNTAPALRSEQVVCIHDANVFLAPESYGFGFRTAYRSLQPLLARRGARIATVSGFSAGQIARHLGLRAADIAVLPNGHEHALAWDPVRARIAPAALASGDMPRRPFVLALGSRARHKNLRLLLAIAPELDVLGLDVLVTGGRAGIFADEALQEVTNVRHLGFVTDHDLAFLMDRALCLAFPSLTEGFGLPALEAMARGCPVVSSDRASLPEICGTAALLTPPDEPRAWVAQIRALLAAPSLRADLVGRGRERAAAYSWSATAEGYADLMTGSWARRVVRTEPDRAVPRVAVAIATLGRPQVASETLRRLMDNQTLKPAAVVVSCVRPEDAGEIARRPGVTLVTSRPGLAAQRNAALAALPKDIDIVAFFDDDFVADPDWLAIAACVFRDEPDVVGFTGAVVADGIKGPGLTFQEADHLLADVRPDQGPLIERFSPYGCNMAFRRSAIGEVRFDERLVLYGWLEDRDFGAALARKGGRLVKCLDARGVHMGVKGGRMVGDRLGYSQVVNPLYMLRKGTMTYRQVLDHLFRNISSNLALSARPEPFIDRRGRLRGNLRGLTDVLLGRLEPERAAEIRILAGR